MDKEKSEREDDCCMTATHPKGIYIVSLREDREPITSKVNLHRIEQAIRNTAAYKEE